MVQSHGGIALIILVQMKVADVMSVHIQNLKMIPSNNYYNNFIF